MLFRSWIKGSVAKLSNDNFLNKAPENVIADAKKHLGELKQKLVRVDEVIETLR